MPEAPKLERRSSIPIVLRATRVVSSFIVVVLVISVLLSRPGQSFHAKIRGCWDYRFQRDQHSIRLGSARHPVGGEVGMLPLFHIESLGIELFHTELLATNGAKSGSFVELILPDWLLIFLLVTFGMFIFFTRRSNPEVACGCKL